MAKKKTPSHGEIAAAAYHRYLTRGGSHGGDFDDWLEAERELAGRGEAKPTPEIPRPKAQSPNPKAPGTYKATAKPRAPRKPRS